MGFAARERAGPTAVVGRAFDVKLGTLQILARDALGRLVGSNGPPTAFSTFEEEILFRHARRPQANAFVAFADGPEK